MTALLPSEMVKDVLVAAGVGVFAPVATGAEGEWLLVISRMRDVPDQQICVLDTGGDTPEHSVNVDYPNVQVLVRGVPDGYKAGWLKAKAVKDCLRGKPSSTAVNGDTLAGVLMQGDIMFLGYDDNARPMFSLNFGLITHAADVTGTHLTQW